MPIEPDEALKKVGEAKRIPKEVFDAFDELIVKSLKGREAKILQKEIGTLVMKKLKTAANPEHRDMTLTDVFAAGWMDVEDAYRKAGWTVVYGKPGYCETYEASFTFTAPRCRGSERDER